MSIKRIAVILLVIFIGLYLIFNVFPIMVVSPASLYYINNHDEVTHNVTVEIFDEHNVSVFKKHYTLGHDESVDLEREVNWHLPFTSSFITWYDGVYTFNFTVDNNVSKDIVRDINQYETIMVGLDSTDYPSSDIVTISIMIASV